MENFGRYVRAPEQWDSDEEYERFRNAQWDSDDEYEQFRNADVPASDDEYERDSDLDLLGAWPHASMRNSVDGREGDQNIENIDNPQQPENDLRFTSENVRNEVSASLAEPQNSGGAPSGMLQRMENVLAAITDKLNYLERAPVVPVYDTDQDWSTPAISTEHRSSGAFSTGVKWDHIKPFPCGVPANKLWETWNGYIENFEMAANLNNVSDHARRSQLLFLSVGEELQGIVRAAKLRPSLDEPDCYKKFVTNLHNYFRTMMDPAAEHENFSKMRQGKTESAIAFHARLTTKVRLCGYNVADHEMFVRSQLLKGMRNRELANYARIYGQPTNEVVQAASRSDCIEAETENQPVNPSSVERTEVYAVQQQRPFDRRFDRRRKMTDERSNKPDDKRARQDSLFKGRRSRCSRCGGIAHAHTRPCPALQRNCAACGDRGHYAKVCRKDQIRQIKDTKNEPFNRADGEEEEQVKVQ